MRSANCGSRISCDLRRSWMSVCAAAPGDFCVDASSDSNHRPGIVSKLIMFWLEQIFSHYRELHLLVDRPGKMQIGGAESIDVLCWQRTHVAIGLIELKPM